LEVGALLEMSARLERKWNGEGRPRWNRWSEATLLVAPFLVVAAGVCVLLLEPVRWCLMQMRPWRRR
jgi:hypothetical protein